MRVQSTTASVPYSRTKIERLIQIDVGLTEGETPWLVCINPWTIHGWRPLSVSNQPAVFITKGMAAAQIASHRNHRVLITFFRHKRYTPRSAIRNTTTAR